MVIDLVCKMTVYHAKAAATSEYKRRKHYFYAMAYKKAFDQNLEKYLAPGQK